MNLKFMKFISRALLMLLFLNFSASYGQQRYLAVSLVNEGNEPKLDVIQQAADVHCNAVFLSIQWGTIHGYISRYNLNKYGANYNLWQMYDDQIAKARSLGMKIGLNIAVSTGDNVAHNPSDRYGTNTGDGWLKEERILNKGYNGQEAVFQKYGGNFDGTNLQFVMTSLAALSTQNRITSFTAEVMQRYKHLLDTGELLSVNLIYTRAGEGEFEQGTDKWDGETVDLQLRDAASLADYSQPMVAKYRTWLQAKYGTIGTLNGIWGTGFSDFNQVSPKVPSSNTFKDPDGRDWYLFRTAVLKETSTIFKNAAKAVDSRVKVLQHHGSVFDKNSMERSTFLFNEIGADLDGIKFNDDNFYDHRFALDLARTNLPGKIYINEAGYSAVNGGINSFLNYATESFKHGAHVVTLMFFETAIAEGHSNAIRNLSDTWVAGQTVSHPTPTNNDSFTLSGIINNDGCYSDRNNYANDCDAYKTWRTANITANDQPVNIFIQNDLNTACPVVTASASNTSPAPGTNINLNSFCSGNCTGVSYTWKLGSTTIGSTQNLSNVTVSSTAGTYTYSVTASKSGCSNVTSNVVVTVTSTPVSGSCYTMRVAGGEQKYLTREGSVPKVRSLVGSGSAAQIWKFEPSGNKYRIVADNGQVLGVQNGGNAADDYIILQPTGSDAYQLWSRQPYGGYEELVRNNSTLLMGVVNFGGGSSGGDSDLRLGSDPTHLYGANKWTLGSIDCSGTPTCPTFTASASNVSPAPGTNINLNSLCSGDCSGVSYTWKLGSTTIGSTQNLSNVTVSSTAGTYTYSVTASKSGCSNVTVNVVVTVTSAPTTASCYTMRVAGGEQKYLTREGSVAKVRSLVGSGSAAQIWKFEPSGNKYRIVADNGQVLGVQNGGNAADDYIILQPTGSDAYQLWSRQPYGGYEELVRNNSTLLMGVVNFGGGSSGGDSDLRLGSDPTHLYGANKWTLGSIGCPGTTNPSEVVCGTIGTCSGNPMEIRSTNLSVITGGVYSLKVTYRAYEGSNTGQVRIGSGPWTTFPTLGTTGVVETRVATIPNITLAAGNNLVELSVNSGGTILCFETVCTASNSGSRIGVAGEPGVAAFGAQTSEKSEMEADGQPELTVYPNPNNGSFDIAFYLDSDEAAALSVTNLMGRTLLNRTVTGRGRHKEKVSLATETSEAVIVQVRTSNRILTKKVVILK